MTYDIQNCIAARLRRLSRIVDGFLRDVLKDVDITENQLNILFALHKMNKKIDQGDLGKFLVLERSTVSRAIKNLEKKGYILKSSNYQPQIALTDSGQIIVLQLIPLWTQFMDDITHKLDEDGLFHLIALEKTLS